MKWGPAVGLLKLPSDSVLRYPSERTEDICPRGNPNPFARVQSSTTHNDHKSLRVHRWMNEHTQWSIPTQEHHTANDRSEALTTAWRDLEDTVRSEGRHKHTACDSVDRKCPEQKSPQTGSRLVGARAG
jgi:hypothetical protein